MGSTVAKYLVSSSLASCKTPHLFPACIVSESEGNGFLFPAVVAVRSPVQVVRVDAATRTVWLTIAAAVCILIRAGAARSHTVTGIHVDAHTLTCLVGQHKAAHRTHLPLDVLHRVAFRVQGASIHPTAAIRHQFAFGDDLVIYAVLLLGGEWCESV